MICIIYNNLFGTDLLISKIISPLDSVKLGESFKIQFELKNQNVQPAFNYPIKTSITDSFGENVFSFDTLGIPLMPFTTQTMTINRDIKLNLAGMYNLKMIVDFQDDIERSNDTTRKSFYVYDDKPKYADFTYKFLIYDFINPKEMPKYGYGSLYITYPPQANWKFFNTLVAIDTSDGKEIIWGVQNALLPQKHDSTTFQISLNYDWLGNNFKIKDKFYSYTYMSDTPSTSLPTKYYWALDSLTVDKINLSNGVKTETALTTTSFTYTPTTQTKVPVIDSVYRGCTVPNLDLDSSKYNPISVPGYAGDINACAPTSAANSMQWLEDKFPQIKSGLGHREKLVELSKIMNRAKEEGVFIREFIEAKLEFINKYKLPIRVKFQVLNQNSNIESQGKIENDAINKGDGKHPKWDFLKQEMKDDEDVEMFLEFHKKIGTNDKVTGRHAVTVSGVADGAGNKILWYKDDSYQEKAGGNTEKQYKWDTLSNSAAVLISPYRNGPYVSGDTTWYTSIFGIVSESYDSTVVFKEKGNLQRLWDGLKGFGRWVIGTDIVETGSPEIEYMNVLGRANSSESPEWIVRNYPIFPSGYDLLRTSFFDLSMMGINSGNPLDSFQAKILYSKNVITSQPVVNNNDWFYYKATNSNAISNESSLDPAAGKPSLDLGSNNYPSYNNTGDILDSVKIDIFDSMIDLNGGIFNSGSVTGYAGDEAAGGPAAKATIIKKLEESFTQIDTKINLRNKLYEISKLCSRQGDKGIDRVKLVKAALNFIDNTKVPIGIKFQSIGAGSGNINSDGGFGHFAKNETPGSGTTDYEWLLTEIKSGRLAAIELGWYDKDGRKKGMWAIVTAIFKQKGTNKIRLLLDWDSKAEGGVTSAVVTLNKTSNPHEIIVELSDKTIKCVIESYITFGYDPSIVFTGVDDAVYYKNLISIKPNPAMNNQNITIEAGIPSAGTVELDIYNLFGNKVINLFEGEHETGLAKFNFSAKGLPAGFYFISIKGKGFISREKLIIN